MSHDSTVASFAVIPRTGSFGAQQRCAVQAAD
jgi:hypothetical protein